MCRQPGGGCQQIEASRTGFYGLGQYLLTAMGWLSTATAVPAVHSSVKVKPVDSIFGQRLESRPLPATRFLSAWADMIL
ncbi:hypothetical protein Taro_039849 [Colocasia esculenta]|uniref:Uncharacterized protein n=1 Tax=Colocasia esculenta TaxID=4460 RepID=A0A843WAC6_COLES|nr:hypothetical protein [Colocasia esculenta]